MFKAVSGRITNVYVIIPNLRQVRKPEVVPLPTIRQVELKLNLLVDLLTVPKVRSGSLPDIADGYIGSSSTPENSKWPE
jgi:hypothetical protein